MYKKHLISAFYFFMTLFLFANLHSLTASINTLTSLLKDKEKIIIESHKTTKNEKQVLKELFLNLDPILLELLNGEKTNKTPEEIKKLLEKADFNVLKIRAKHIDEKGTDGYAARLTLLHEKLPDYVIKIGFDNNLPFTNISRIIRSDFINAIINTPEYLITTIEKVEKKLCKQPNKPNDLIDHNYIILSPLIKGKEGETGTQEEDLCFKSYTNKHLKDFLTIMELLQYEDSTPSNIIMNENNKTVIIDTEVVNHEYPFYKELLMIMLESYNEDGKIDLLKLKTFINEQRKKGNLYITLGNSFFPE